MKTIELTDEETEYIKKYIVNRNLIINSILKNCPEEYNNYYKTEFKITQSILEKL